MSSVSSTLYSVLPSDPEAWKSLLEKLAAFFGLVAAACVCVALVFSGKATALQKAANERQAREMQELRIQLAGAQEQAADAGRRSAEIEIDLTKAKMELLTVQKKLAPRHLNLSAFLGAASWLATAPSKPQVAILYFKDDPECLALANEISNALVQVKWGSTSLGPIPNGLKGPMGVEVPSAMTVGGRLSGVTIVVSEVLLEESEALRNRNTGRDWLKTPWTVLVAALKDSLDDGVSLGNGSPNPPLKGWIRIVVAPK